MRLETSQHRLIRRMRVGCTSDPFLIIHSMVSTKSFPVCSDSVIRNDFDYKLKRLCKATKLEQNLFNIIKDYGKYTEKSDKRYTPNTGV